MCAINVIKVEFTIYVRSEQLINIVNTDINHDVHYLHSLSSETRLCDSIDAKYNV